MSKMNKRHLEIARQHLALGNVGCYARQMRACIDCSMSDRVVKQFTDAIESDGFTHAQIRDIALSN